MMSALFFFSPSWFYFLFYAQAGAAQSNFAAQAFKRLINHLKADPFLCLTLASGAPALRYNAHLRMIATRPI